EDRMARRRALSGLRREALAAAGRRGPWAAILTAKEYSEIMPREGEESVTWRLLARLEYRGQTVYIVGSDSG
ncbi:MAG: hypothetical protein N3A38_17345, partial [Planctomycetota bacterium]|nr:hypothetical protein [Planctomycetota bacterium]